MYVLDEKRTIVFANGACLNWLGALSSRVVGQRVDFHSSTVPVESGGPASECLAGLCPAPDVLEAGQGVAEVWCCPTDGSRRSRLAHVFSMPSDGSTRRHLLVLLDDQDLPPANGSPSVRRQVDAAGEDDDLHGQLLELHRRLQAPYRLEALLGQTPAMQRVRRQVEVAAATRANVLVWGEPGCGREQVARTIYRLRSSHTSIPLVPLDCRILDAELLESTLQSLLRSGGTLKHSSVATLLLLDVDQLERPARGVLRAVLEHPEFAVGTLATASLMPPTAPTMLEDDFLAVLATVEVRLPALRDRLADLPLLLQSAVETLNAQGGRQVAGFAKDALDALTGHPWRRNLDELREVVTEAWSSTCASWIGRGDLPAIIGWTADAEDYPVVPPEMSSLDDYLATIERELLRRALRRAQGNRAEAARLLGIPRSRLLRKLELLDSLASRLDPSEEREGPPTRVRDDANEGPASPREESPS